MTWLFAAAFTLPADTFDILSFTPPAGWEKAVLPNDHVLFTGYNASRSAFCQLTGSSRQNGTSSRRDGTAGPLWRASP